jgi:hypothetical protein
MNRHEQFLFAYLLISVLRLIVSAIAGTHGFHSEQALKAFTEESDRLHNVEKELFFSKNDTGLESTP